MVYTKLSSKGQVIIPKAVRSAQHWEAGQELVVVEVDDGILLKPRNPFEQTELKNVAGCLKYSGPANSLDEMDDAIRKGILEDQCNIS
ncbi:MAG: AbrB/MazE/SpoVT family DNA-binding domain-containing protein [Candidatus Latescibacteria bacterium]|jgi:AbrB family looped-hinge helix DNA binding protein|nr:AbrB/MazE/SpoVT family DNA-binding domain-containing protein [Candidatus Latescibacterota bacterium]